MKLTDAILVGLSTARLTRLVTTDTLGTELMTDRLAAAIQTRWPDETDQWKAEGLYCPHCVGFWLGAAVLASYHAVGHTRAWRFGAAALSLNYIAGHLSARLDS